MDKKDIEINVLKKVIILILFVIILSVQKSNFIFVLGDSTEEREKTIKTNIEYSQMLSSAQNSINDTTAPKIIFIQPSSNNSIISYKSYSIIINIADDNAPLPGNVIIQISNFTTPLFNASMSSTVDDHWIFNWNNLTSYKNRETYILQVWAMDSSLNSNFDWSGEYYIYIRTQNSPGMLNMILYLIIFSAIFAVVCVYLNKRAVYKLSKKERKNAKKDL